MAVSHRQAVDQTLAYSRHFGLPLTPEKLHFWLISPHTVAKEKIIHLSPHLTLKDKRLLRQRALYSRSKIAKAARVARLLGYWPSIKLICATGSLAVDNARKNDDLDIMIVTSPETLWLTRPLVIFFLKLLNLRRPASLSEHHSPRVADKICDNLWLDETSLAIPQKKRNLFTAHEVIQAKPLFDRGNTYAKFILANSWTKKYLANAYTATQTGIHPGGGVAPAAHPRGVLLKTENWILKILNIIAFFFQYHYMKRKITRETITLHSAYFHPNDYGTIKLDG